MAREDGSIDWRVDRSDAGVRLAGRLVTPDAPQILASIRKLTKGADALEIDLDDVEHIDPDIVALLGADFRTRHLDVHMRGGDRFQSLFELCTEEIPAEGRIRRPHSLLYQVGRKTIAGVRGLKRLLAFVGELGSAVWRVVSRPSAGHWSDVPLLVERAGLDAVPILLLINFLIGFVLAYMAARSLAMFGAHIYVADLVGIGMTRQLGPLMTGIIVCGRSGAAFTAELGSMKVAEEIDALRTLGLQPFDWLVLPRIVALVLVMPVLTVMADGIGMVGGMVVAATSLDIAPQSYVGETIFALVPWDVTSGVIMSVSFAVAIALIGCAQGMAASAGPLGVGRRTTATVVISLFTMVALDAILTVTYRALGLS
jgi:phospholipid/cholesterol/gamma-HCH transport system permease protein